MLSYFDTFCFWKLSVTESVKIWQFRTLTFSNYGTIIFLKMFNHFSSISNSDTFPSFHSPEKPRHYGYFIKSYQKLSFVWRRVLHSEMTALVSDSHLDSSRVLYENEDLGTDFYESLLSDPFNIAFEISTWLMIQFVGNFFMYYLIFAIEELKVSLVWHQKI